WPGRPAGLGPTAAMSPGPPGPECSTRLRRRRRTCSSCSLRQGGLGKPPVQPFARQIPSPGSWEEGIAKRGTTRVAVCRLGEVDYYTFGTAAPEQRQSGTNDVPPQAYPFAQVVPSPIPKGLADAFGATPPAAVAGGAGRPHPPEHRPRVEPAANHV